MSKQLKTGVVLLAIALAGCANGTGKDLDEVLNKAHKEGKSVMLELGSVGCIPCEQMKPVMEKLRRNYAGKLEVIFVDVRKDREIGRRYGIAMIPTQVFLDKKGKEFHRHVGYYSYEEIIDLLKKRGG